MTTHKEVLTLALEAFTIVRFCVPPAQRPTIERAITAIKEALAQPEQELFLPPNNFYKDVDEAINKLEKNGSIFDGNDSAPYVVWLLRTLRELATQTQPKEPEQEPVASLADVIRAEPTELIHKWRVLEIVKDYTIPPQRKPLTDEQLPAMWTEAVRKAALPPNKSALIHYKEAIEGAYGIKG